MEADLSQIAITDAVDTPQSEYLNFNIDIENVPEELRECIRTIKQVAEGILYHWKSFPIQLPSPVYFGEKATKHAEVSSPTSSTSSLPLRDLFITPNFDELEEVALGENKEGKSLSIEQLMEVRRCGEFNVPSKNFPGQLHLWRLSLLLQKGKERVRASLLKDISHAARLIIIVARNRIHSNLFSLTHSFWSLIDVVIMLLDMLFGMPSTQVPDLVYKLFNERQKYLVAELSVTEEAEGMWHNLCAYIKQKCFLYDSGKGGGYNRSKYTSYNEVRRSSGLNNENLLPPLPYIYQTPTGLTIDLRLFDKHLLRILTPILENILVTESKGWFIQYREKCISELKDGEFDAEEVSRLVKNRVRQEYLKRIHTSIERNEEIARICGGGIGQLLIEQSTYVVVLNNIMEDINHDLGTKVEQVRIDLSNSHPVFSLISSWMKEKIRVSEEEFLQENMWRVHHEGLKQCLTLHLEQAAYFLNRDLVFLKEREGVLQRELENVRDARRRFEWHSQIWNPQHWRVTRVCQGRAERVATVIKDTPPYNVPKVYTSEAVFIVVKHRTHVNSTRYPLWRWCNYLYRTLTWTWNALFLFLIFIPFCTPVGMKALLSRDSFMPDYELSQYDGALYPREESLTHSFLSRLYSLWRHISKSRTHFETQPDTGFIGKGFMRHFNRLWNYVCKGVFGTLLIVLFFPLTCLLVNVLSVVLALTVVIW